MDLSPNRCPSAGRSVSAPSIQLTLEMFASSAACRARISMSGSGSTPMTLRTFAAIGNVNWPVPQPRSTTRSSRAQLECVRQDVDSGGRITVAIPVVELHHLTAETQIHAHKSAIQGPSATHRLAPHESFIGARRAWRSSRHQLRVDAKTTIVNRTSTSAQRRTNDSGTSASSCHAIVPGVASGRSAQRFALGCPQEQPRLQTEAVTQGDWSARGGAVPPARRTHA